MTEEFEPTKIEPTMPEATTENLSTREFMEKNWDRFVKEEADESTLSFEDERDDHQEPDLSDPPFDAGSFLNENFESLKETLQTRGISSPKDWLESLVALEKLYQESPKEVFRQLALSAGFELPKKEKAVDILTEYALRNNIPHEKMLQAMSPKSFSSPFSSFLTKTNPEAALKQGKSLQEMDSSSFKQLIKEELSLYFKEKNEETQKAKNSSFSPKGVGLKASKNTAYTASGKPKTTREILEEGWRLLGL